MRKYLIIAILFILVSFSVSAQSPTPSSTPTTLSCNDGTPCNSREEQCEGDNTCGATCSSLVGFVGGPLGCTEDCKFDTSNCIECYTKEDCEGKTTDKYCSSDDPPENAPWRSDIWGNKAACMENGKCGPGELVDCQKDGAKKMCYEVPTGGMSDLIYCVNCITNRDCKRKDAWGWDEYGTCKKGEFKRTLEDPIDPTWIAWPPEQWICDYTSPSPTPQPDQSPVRTQAPFESTAELTTTDPTSLEMVEYFNEVEEWVLTPI
jgi:hypothetical protein